MPVKSTLQVIADYAGHALVLDPAISGTGAFNYDCVPWNVILQDIAKNHGLSIRVDNRTIIARRP
jgi:type II secretory pathway component HofQ